MTPTESPFHPSLNSIALTPQPPVQLMLSTIPICAGLRLSEPCVSAHQARPKTWYCHFSVGTDTQENVTM